MKESIHSTELENIKIKPIAMPSHQIALRSKLLTSTYWENKHKEKISLWKGGEYFMKKRKFALLGATLSIIVVIFAVAFLYMPKNTKTAYAEEVAQKSMEAVATLTPDQREKLKQTVQFGKPEEILERAKNAKDLKILTYDQFVKTQPMVPPERKAQDGMGPDLHSLNFLQFTDTDGSKVTLGVDPQTNLPVLILASRTEPEDQSHKSNTRFKIEQGTQSGVASEGIARPGFESGDKKMQVMFSTDEQGKPTFIVNGKKYTLPTDVKLTTNGPPDITFKDNNVYINGEQAIPVE